MTLLPILERELQVRARRRTGHWARFGIALGAFLICLPQLLFSGPFGPATTFGKGMFDCMVAGAFVLSCGACFLSANAIAAEHREGTLGLLFLTRVNALDVLLGKFGSSGLTSLCGLLAFVPVMLVPIFAGGVTGMEALRKGVALTATLLLALALGLWASVATRPGNTLRHLLGTLVLVVVLPYLLWSFGSGSAKALGLLSPLVCVISAGDVPYRAGPLWFWGSAFATMAMAAVALLCAVKGLPKVAFLELETAPAAPTGAAKATNVSATGPRRWGLRAEHPHPVAWLVRRQPGVQSRLWAAALLSCAYQGWMMFLPRWFAPTPARSMWAFYWLPGLVVSGLTSALIASAATRFFVAGRQSAELEVLFTTPLGTWTVVAEQWQALSRMLRGPILLMVLPSLLRVLMTLHVLPGPANGPIAGMSGGQEFAFFVIGILSVFLHLASLCWLSLWFGFKARNQASAVLWSVCLATAVPYLLNTILFGILAAFLSGWMRMMAWPYALSWCTRIAVMLAQLALLAWARGRLKSRLGPGASNLAGLQNSLTAAAQDTASAFRRARHWTPS